MAGTPRKEIKESRTAKLFSKFVWADFLRDRTRAKDMENDLDSVLKAAFDLSRRITAGDLRHDRYGASHTEPNTFGNSPVHTTNEQGVPDLLNLPVGVQAARILWTEAQGEMPQWT